MYPFSTSQDFAFNQWYVAAWDHEVTQSLLPRRILDTPLVFYRTESGDVTAMLDMCPHRRIPLSQGKLQNDVVQCRYHGFQFDKDGACVKIPAQNQVPEGFRVRTFPVVKRWEWLWIWMGDPELADPATIPDNEAITSDRSVWGANIGGTQMVPARYGLIHENLLDLSHLSFLHQNSIGSAGVAGAKIHIRETDGYLTISRYVIADCMDDQAIAKIASIKGPVDRTMIQQFYPPSLHVTGTVFTSSQEGGIDPGREFAAFRFFHGLTPETRHSTHYFWGFARNFMTDSEPLNAGMRKEICTAMAEDISALEAIEANLDEAADPRDDIHCRADAAGLRGRLVLERMIAKEHGEPMPGMQLHDAA